MKLLLMRACDEDYSTACIGCCGPEARGTDYLALNEEDFPEEVTQELMGERMGGDGRKHIPGRQA